MLKQFLNHIEQNNLFEPADKILLAISGGVDSVVMFHLFRQAGFEIGVAHCNFQLRGEASVSDELFVRQLCLQKNVPFHIQRFDTDGFAEDTGQSIQMAARALRYRFFEGTMEQFGYRYIATAHHLNDSLETVLLNFVRGTGLDGLTGISIKQDNRIRPLLFATRSEIESYALSNGLLWREDASNASDAYNRNLLRNQVMPILRRLNPALENVFKETQERIIGSSSLASESIERFEKEWIGQTGAHTHIRKEGLTKTTSPAVLLWEVIKEKGFNYDQCKRIILEDHRPGKVYYSHTHQLTIDRDDLILSVRRNEDYPELKIDQPLGFADNGVLKLMFETMDRENFKLEKDASIAQLDRDTLQFPLTWRRWKKGDYFTPLGMNQSKKVSDFLIDAKVSVPDKQLVTVLESAGTIAWVVGYRVNDKFKVSDQTKCVVVIKVVS